MALGKSVSDINKIYKKFQERTGISITDEPLNKVPDQVAREAGPLFPIIHTKPKQALLALEPLVEKYPEEPSLKNHLYICYSSTGQHDKAKEILDRTLREHPNYIFGITARLLETTDKKEIEELGAMLGTPRDIRAFSPDASKYHISEFVAYESGAILYEAATGDEKSALARLENLLELEVDENKLKPLARRISGLRVAKGMERLDTDNAKGIAVKSRPTIGYTVTDKPPTLTHPELEVFYRTSPENLPKSEIEKILRLPQESLVKDLEAILADSIQRYEYFLKQPDCEFDTLCFPQHALFFLGALKVESSLPKVLNLLRMGEGFTDFWFFDSLEDIFHPVLYSLGQNQLEVLKDYVLMPHHLSFDRWLVCHVPSQVALHQPERRAEVVKWFEDVFHYFLQNPDQEGLIDSDFISFTVGEIMDFQGKELLHVIEDLYAKEWVKESAVGSLDEVKKEMNQPNDPSLADPMPANVYEYYSEEYRKRRAERPEWKKNDLASLISTEASKAEQFVQKISLESFFKSFPKEKGTAQLSNNDEDDYENTNHEPVVQYKREGPKVGRNDPCPCGSGKKYKKCCMKN